MVDYRSVGVRLEPRGVWIRRLALASIAGQAVWIVLVAVAGAIEPGYTAIRDAVSELGAATAARPWLFGVAVTIWGLSFVAAGLALALDGGRGLRARLGPGLIALTGLAQILDGFPFPADCRTTIDAGCRAMEMAGDVSWQHAAHGWTYFIGALALMLSVYAMAWRLRGDSRWGRADLLAVGAGLLAPVLVVLLFLVAGDGAEDRYGLIQRLILAAAMLWVLALTVALLAIHGRRGDPAVRLVEWLRGLPGGRLLVVPGSGLGASAPRPQGGGAVPDLTQLPPDLPVPEDDGAASHLDGAVVPALALPTTEGGRVDLARVAAGESAVVVYVYPRTGVPGEPLPPGWDETPGARGCTPQSCAFRDSAAELRGLGATVFGLSAQPLEEQREFASREQLPYPLLNDSDFRLAAELHLPTFEIDGTRYYRRLTFIARAGGIAKVFYPVFPPQRNAADAIAWLRARAQS